MRRAVGVVALLVLLTALAALVFDPRGVREYWLHFTEDRPPLDLPLSEISQEWTEQALRANFPSLRIDCYHNLPGQYLDDRSCFADISAHNGVPAMAVAFHLARGKVNHVTIHMPSWVHARMHAQLLGAYGPAVAVRRRPVEGYRLVGWKLGNGALFVNGDRPLNPLAVNQALWMSERACSEKPCWREPAQRSRGNKAEPSG